MIALVSVLIPAFRAEAYLARAVASALAQDGPTFEIVIATDDGVDYASVLAQAGIHDPRIVHTKTGGMGLGASAARNAALRAAQGRIILPLDADDNWGPGYLARMAGLAEAHGAALSQVTLLRHDNGEALPNHSRPAAPGWMTLVDVLPACVHAWTPIVFDRARMDARWREEVRLLEDLALLAECADQLGGVWYAGEAGYRYHHRAGSACNDADAALRFFAATEAIRALVAGGTMGLRHPHTLLAALERNDELERRFVASGLESYQDFLATQHDLLHAPLP